MSLSARCCLSAALLAAALLARPALSQPRLPLERSHDYLVPSAAEVRTRATAVKVLGGKAFGSGERVSYRAFDGKTYSLTRFHGLYVDLFLPDSWLGPDALSEEQARHFVDRTDLIYQHLLDMVGVPPAGDGPLPIAVVPDTCGGALGCGSVGSKGVEMSDVPEYRSLYWRQIAEDFPSGVLVHELTHNFDVFSADLGYVPDSAHAWTNFITNYYFNFTHEGGLDITPEETTRTWLGYSSPYFEDPTATWGSCVRDDQCQDRYIRAELAWGGFGWRIALRHGPQTVLGFASFLRQYQQFHEPPKTAEEKNDLYVEALAAGAQVNLSCVADAWRWPISDSLRQRMRQRYGNRAPECQDLDHDGFTPLQGDCDDRRSDVRPGAQERRNRLDDDCDGGIDEILYRGGGGGSTAAPQSLALPAEIHGGTDPSSPEIYQFHLRSPDRIQFKICFEPGLFGQLTIVDATFQPVNNLITGGGCTWQAYSLGAGDWYFAESLFPASDAGYTLAVQKATPWPLPPWARTAPPRLSGNRFVLTAPTALSRLPAQPREVRFWVSGQGVVGTVPYTPAASFAWTPPPGVDPVAQGLTYRAEIRTGGAPVYEVTPPRGFE